MAAAVAASQARREDHSAWFTAWCNHRAARSSAGGTNKPLRDSEQQRHRPFVAVAILVPGFQGQEDAPTSFPLEGVEAWSLVDAPPGRRQKKAAILLRQHSPAFGREGLEIKRSEGEVCKDFSQAPFCWNTERELAPTVFKEGQHLFTPERGEVILSSLRGGGVAVRVDGRTAVEIRERDAFMFAVGANTKAPIELEAGACLGKFAWETGGLLWKGRIRRIGPQVIDLDRPEGVQELAIALALDGALTHACVTTGQPGYERVRSLSYPAPEPVTASDLLDLEMSRAKVIHRVRKDRVEAVAAEADMGWVAQVRSLPRRRYQPAWAVIDGLERELRDHGFEYRLSGETPVVVQAIEPVPSSERIVIRTSGPTLSVHPTAKLVAAVGVTLNPGDVYASHPANRLASRLDESFRAALQAHMTEVMWEAEQDGQDLLVPAETFESPTDLELRLEGLAAMSTWLPDVGAWLLPPYRVEPGEAALAAYGQLLSVDLTDPPAENRAGAAKAPGRHTGATAYKR